MKYLHLNGHLPCDMSGLLPNVHVLGNKRIAACWDRDSVMKILGCIDRANPVGKRDYAAFVMVAELGLRASDINGLNLLPEGANPNWHEDKSLMSELRAACRSS